MSLNSFIKNQIHIVISKNNYNNNSLYNNFEKGIYNLFQIAMDENTMILNSNLNVIHLTRKNTYYKSIEIVYYGLIYFNKKPYGISIEGMEKKLSPSQSYIFPQTINTVFLKFIDNEIPLLKTIITFEHPLSIDKDYDIKINYLMYSTGNCRNDEFFLKKYVHNLTECKIILPEKEIFGNINKLFYSFLLT